MLRQQSQTKKLPNLAHLLIGIGMLVILGSMQWDFAFHVTEPFDSYISIQHFAIYVGVLLVAFTAGSRFAIRKAIGIKIDRATKLALVGIILMFTGGGLDFINHEFIIKGFDSLFSWSHIPFVVGTMVIAVSVLVAYRHTKLSIIGWTVTILAVLALLAVFMLQEMPDNWTPYRPVITWSVAIFSSYCLARELG